VEVRAERLHQDSTRTGHVTRHPFHRSKWGKGVYTFDADADSRKSWKWRPTKIRVGGTRPGRTTSFTPIRKLGFQANRRASTSIAAFYEPFRQGRRRWARTMLVAAAGRRTWGVDASSCRAENGTVIHSAEQPEPCLWRPGGQSGPRSRVPEKGSR